MVRTQEQVDADLDVVSAGYRKLIDGIQYESIEARCAVVLGIAESVALDILVERYGLDNDASAQLLEATYKMLSGLRASARAASRLSRH